MAEVFNLQAKIGLDIQYFVNGIKKAASAGADLKKKVEDMATSVVSAQKGTDKTANSIEELGDATSTAKKSVSEYRSDVMKLASAYQKEGIPKSEAMKKAYQEIDKSLYDLGKQSDETGKKNEKLGDKTKKAGKDAESAKVNFEKFGNTLKSVASTAGKVVSAVAKISGVAIGAAATGLTALTKQALDASASYEQLKGGVETLFGAGGMSLQEYAASVGKSVDEARGHYERLMSAQDKVMQNSYNAFKTAGMSSNQYMETVTSFSASLLQSVAGDTSLAADIADMAIRDMSDNANKMGTDMQSIQNAYQGFAKQNYTMLDNLKLGYGGTKTEMERLLADAEKLSGQKYSIDSLMDVYNAIHLVQEEMGITGTTAKEAAGTIEGSVGSFKAAWENLVTAFGSTDMPIDTFVTNFVDSIGTAANNVVPRIGQIINSIGMVFPDLVSSLFDTLKSTFEENDIGSVIFKGIETLVTNGAQVIEDVMKSLFDSLPAVLEGAGNTLGTVTGALWNIFKSAVEILPDKLPGIIDIVGGMIGNLLDTLTSDLPSITASITEIITKLIDGLSTLINAESIKNLIPVVVQSLLDIASALLDNADTLIDVALELIVALGQGLIDSLPAIYDFIYKIVPQIVEILLSNIEPIMNAGFTLLNALLDKLPEILDIVSEQMPKVIYAITDSLLQHMPDIIMAGLQLLEALFERTPEIIEMGNQFVGDLITNLVTTFSDNWDDLKQSGIDALTKWWDGARELVDNAAEWGEDLIKNFVDGIKNKIYLVTNAVSSVAQTIRDYIGFSEPKKGVLSNFHTYATDMIDLFTSGISENAYKIGDTFNKALDFDTNIGTATVNASSTAQDALSASAVLPAGGSWGELFALLNAILIAIKQNKVLDTEMIDRGLGMLQTNDERGVLA